jgi:hypothetical protein
MTAFSPTWRAHFLAFLLSCSAGVVGCSSEDEPPGSPSDAVAAGAGGVTSGGFGGAAVSASGARNTAGERSTAGRGTGAVGSSGGSSPTGQAGRAADPGAGQGGLGGPPAVGADGLSPYQRECHGDTLSCEDVATLRCLGIRNDSTVYGYSCSNPCTTDSDCADAPSSSESEAACVDFVTQKHCLLVCLSQGSMRSCPAGMGCYIYPQSTVGYCLWQ